MRGERRHFLHGHFCEWVATLDWSFPAVTEVFFAGYSTLSSWATNTGSVTEPGNVLGHGAVRFHEGDPCPVDQ